MATAFSSSAFTIRQAHGGDANQLAELNLAFNGSSPSPDRVRQALDSLPEVVLVAEQDNRRIGFVALHAMRSFCYSAPWIELTELYLTPSHRRSGAGVALCREAIKVSEALGAAQIWLRTGSDNVTAHRVYQRAGFEAANEAVWRRFLSQDIP